MIQKTLERVKPVVSAGQVWMITNELLAKTIAKQLPEVTEKQILREPAARNTAPACGLAAFLLERHSPDTVLGVFPSDHAIGDVARFRRVVRAGAALARRSGGNRGAGRFSRPAGDRLRIHRAGSGPRSDCRGGRVDSGAARAALYREAGQGSRRSGFCVPGIMPGTAECSCGRAKTLADAMREHQPETAAATREDCRMRGERRSLSKVFAELYPQCENISIDYAVLEPRSAKGEGKSRTLLPAGGFRMERSGFVGGAA